MSFDKEQYWKDRVENIGSIRNKRKRNRNLINPRIIGNTILEPTVKIPKKPSKYAIRKNTKRAVKYNKYNKEEQ